MRYRINYTCASDVGRIRSMNQDNFICDGCYMEEDSSQKPFLKSGSVLSEKISLFGIFDGMGGEECGEVASLIAAREAANINSESSGFATLSGYCTRANRAICDYADSNSISAMGTTAAMLHFSKDKITLCNIGDSKIFRLSAGKIKQISTDHIAISVYGRKPPLTQHLGLPEDFLLIEPYFSHGGYVDGDKYLISSDGLTDMVCEEEINEIVNENSVDGAVQMLLEKALENGGRDNITIILLEIKNDIESDNILKI